MDRIGEITIRRLRQTGEQMSFEMKCEAILLKYIFKNFEGHRRVFKKYSNISASMCAAHYAYQFIQCKHARSIYSKGIFTLYIILYFVVSWQCGIMVSVLD